MAKQSKQLTEAEARIAFYLDFEGNKDKPPVLMGYWRKKHVQQFVVDRVFRAAGPGYLELRQAVKTIVSSAEKQNKRIVSWSEHDLEIVRSLSNEPALVQAFEARYANGRALAARWATLAPKIEKPATGDLEHYLDLVRFKVPEAAGPGKVGDTIRSLRPTLEGGRELSENQLQRWEDLLAHNRMDCEGTRAVCVRAAADLERMDKKRRKAKRGRKGRSK